MTVPQPGTTAEHVCPTCGGVVEAKAPDPPLPAPLPDWLRDPHPDGFFGPSDCFAVQVVHRSGLDRRERIESARAFYVCWGKDALMGAIRVAATVGPLPQEIIELRAMLEANQ